MAKLIDLIVSGKSSFANDISAKNIYADKFATTGGTAADVVRGDGTLQTIASLSVNYASSAGYTTRLYANSTSDLITYPGDYSLAYSRFSANASNKFPVVSNANGVITAHLHNGNYFAQIGLSSDGRMYYRAMMNSALNSGVAWNKVAWATEIPTVTNYYWANVLISATSNSSTSPTFSNVTTTGLLTVSNYSTHKGIKVGNTYINAINGELIFQNNSAIRFGGDSWDYNVWAGLKYVHSTKTVYLGLADGSAFTANNAQSGGKLYLPGIANIYTGNGTNLVWHAGNDGSGSGLDADTVDSLHASSFMRATSDGTFYGIQHPDGSTSSWTRTTSSGIIPYTSGGASSLGTDSWPFSTVYAIHFYMSGYLYMKFGGSWLSTIDNDGNGPIFGYALALNNRRVYYTGSPVYICGGSYNNYGNGITVNSSNNIGIGNSSPSYKLDVNGDTRILGNLYLGANSSNNYIAFYGNTGDNPGSYVTTFIGEHLWGSPESTELLLMKFNDVGNGTDATTVYGSGPDRIRHLAHGHVFQIMTDVSQGDFVTMANSTAVETKFDIARYQLHAYAPLAIISDGTNSGYDALVYMRHYSNNDWGLVVDKSESYSYGVDIRAAGTYALKVGSGNTRLIGATIIGADDVPSYTLDVRGTTRSTGRIYANEWIQFDNGSGLYWPNNYGAHFYPNDTSSYGQFRLAGNKNGYSGIHFGNGTGYLTLMDNGSDKGAYQENWNWIWYFNARNGKLSFRTSSDLGADNNFDGSVRTNSTYYGYGLYHLSYGSSNYFLTSDGSARHWPDLYDGRYLQYEGWWSDGSGQNVNDSHGMNFTYTSHGAPRYWGTTVTFEYNRNSDYRLQLHGTGDNYLYFRNRSADYGGWHSSGWKQILTNQDTYVTSDGTNRGIINGSEVASARHLLINGVTWNSDWHWYGQGGQPTWLWGSNDGYSMYVWNPSNFSVNYANSAGSANSAERANYLSGHGVNPDNSHPGHGARVFYSWNAGQAYNSSEGYSNGITIGSHPGDTNYGFQIVQNMWDDRTYTRRYNGGWQSWKTLAWLSDIPTSLPANGGTSSAVTINYNNDSNSTYQMLWGSGNYVYGTGGIYCNPYYDYIYASAFYETSDIRLKQNIKPLFTSNNIPQIKEFDWKNTGKHSYGLIAQELEYMGYFELVDTKDDGYKSVNYTAAHSLIIGKLQLKIKELEDRIKYLESK